MSHWLCILVRITLSLCDGGAVGLLVAAVKDSLISDILEI